MAVICRIGSLEISASTITLPFDVICRIGSLETKCGKRLYRRNVICRIGSLESYQSWRPAFYLCYLPYRQLRN